MEQERGLRRAKAERAAKQKRARKRKRILALAIEIAVFILLLGMWFVISKYGKLQVHLWGAGDIVTNEGVSSNDCKTIAVFGVDSKDGNLDSGTYSDTIMLISIHQKTKEVKVVSVYQNLITMQMDGTIHPAKEAYYRGGPQEAVSMLNRNFDLEISGYISVDYAAVVHLIDSLGGLEWTLTEAEAAEMNLHIAETAVLTGTVASEVKSGLQILDGVKTLTYLRICKNVGGDINRTGRHAMVVKAVLEKVKKADFTTVNRIMNETFTRISTSFTLKECISIATSGMTCKSVEFKSYAFEYKEETVKGIKNAVIPLGVKENISELHAFLYAEPSYHVTKTVKEIADEIEAFTGYGRADYERTE